MADLLRSGYTMLNLACPVCNNPLFRNKNNEIFCSICNKRVLIKKNDISQSNKIETNPVVETSFITNNQKSTLKFNSLKVILEEKIDWISQKLKDETQIDLIENYLRVLTKTYKLLKKLM
ncbi:MAG: Sjogren's syndrome/scleroderma autoantigen 1 family protein [Promethearchaeota archaeon]